MYTGDLYDPSLSTKDIAARLRQDLKNISPSPIKFFLAVNSWNSLTITIKGPSLLDDKHRLTDEGKELKLSAEVAANRYNYDRNPPGYMGDPEPRNFLLDIRVENAYSKQEVTAEANRLKEVYWIKDADTLSETKFSLWSMNAVTPFTEAALALLQTEFHVAKPKKPEFNHAVTAAFTQWVERSKSWVGNTNVQYDRGPKYWRLELNGKVLCFVDRIDGTIYKASFRKAMTDSPRGTIFDGFNVFENGRLLKKEGFDWMVRFSNKTGRQFQSFTQAWEYRSAQFKLQQLFGREPTQEEVIQEMAKTDSQSHPLPDECSLQPY